MMQMMIAQIIMPTIEAKIIIMVSLSSCCHQGTFPKTENYNYVAECDDVLH